MQKNITVKGVGNVSARPDLVVLTLSLESLDKNYDEAMSLEERKLAQLKEALISAGFPDDCLKTTDFNVRTEYENVQDLGGIRHNEFRGYVVRHSLKVSFDFTNERLSRALAAVSGCLSNPDLSVRFTVKDQTALKEKMLVSAAENAKRTAEVLCRASGERLGELLTINYNWGEIDVYSPTTFRMQNECVREARSVRSMDIEPDDIEESDTVTFVWEIEKDEE